MDEKYIAEIVRKVFEKAKTEHASHSRFALSSHISDHSDLSSKTLERAYDRYINKKKKYGAPQAESVDLCCKYLGYDNYADYIKKRKTVPATKWTIPILVVVSLVLAIVMGIRYGNNTNPTGEKAENQCMAWADSLYVEVPCTSKPYSSFGTKVEPMDITKLKHFKKVEVNMATQFFSEDDKPLLWYHKNKEGEIEYFTAPGLHPTNDKTLRKITPYIIQTYVPVHSYKKESFLE